MKKDHENLRYRMWLQRTALRQLTLSGTNAQTVVTKMHSEHEESIKEA